MIQLRFVETQAAVNWLKWGKAPGICGIHAELLKVGVNVVLMSLHAVKPGVGLVVRVAAWDPRVLNSSPVGR